MRLNVGEKNVHDTRGEFLLRPVHASCERDLSPVMSQSLMDTKRGTLYVLVKFNMDFRFGLRVLSSFDDRF